MEKARELQTNIYFCFTDYTKAFDCVDHNKLWKIMKEMGIPDHVTCLLRNLYAGQEATVRTGHGTDWFQMEKEYVRAIYCHPAYLTYMQSTHDWSDLAVAVVAEYIMRNTGLEEAQLESRLPGEITSDMQMTPPLWQKVKRN